MIRNLLLTLMVFVLSGFVLWLTLTRLDPLGINQVPAYFAFFVSFFLSTSLFLTFLFFFASEVKRRRKLGTRHYLVALRRGMLGGMFLVGVVVLQLLGMIRLVECKDVFDPQRGCLELFWGLNGLFEVALWGVFLVLLEYICISTRKKYTHT